jgi:DNA-binding LytR/AlgR family response regulator
MENTENANNPKPSGKRPGGNHLHSPAKPPSEELKEAMADLSRIVFITVVENYVRIYYSDLTNIFVKGTLKTACLLCQADGFMKTHKSYVVNLKFGTIFHTVKDNYEMRMTNDETVIVGNNYKDEFIEKIKPFSNITRKKNG